MDEEVKDAKRTAKDALRKASKLSFIMYNKLQRLKDLSSCWRVKNRRLQMNLASEKLFIE